MLNPKKAEEYKQSLISILRRQFLATVYSWNGLKFAIRHEQSLRTEVGIFVIAFIVLQIINISYVDQARLLGSLALIIMMELQNTATEKLADRVTKDYDEVIKVVKDCSSAAVFVALVVAMMTWGCFFYELFQKKGWL